MTDIDTGDDLDRFADQLLNMIVTLPDGTKDTRRLEGFLDALDPDDRILAHQAIGRRVADPYSIDPDRWVREKLRESLWSKQRTVAESVRDNRYTAVPSCHDAGKALALDTPLPTPTGWTTMGNVAVGDLLLDEHGHACTVTATSAIQHRDTYRVSFDDGTSIVANDEHEWQVIGMSGRRRAQDEAHTAGPSLDYRDRWDLTVNVDTVELRDGLLTRNGQRNWGIPCARPLAGTPTVLPVGPYTIGVWLGDGTTIQPAVTLNRWDSPEILAGLHAEGTVTRARPSADRESTECFGFLGALDGFRALDLIGHKHIPPAVLRADLATRLAVLQGIMDTDGFRGNGNNDAALDLMCEELADGVAELVRTFGWKARRSTKRAIFNGVDVGTVYRLTFRPDLPVFRLARYQRPAEHVQASRHTIRTVTAVDPIEIVPTRCVMVDSPSHLYLAGEAMIPTHNSHLAARLAAWWIDSHAPGEAFVVTTAPTFAQVRAILWRYIGQAHRKGDLVGRVNQTEWHIGPELVAYGRKPADTGTGHFQGIHARYVLVIIDEACGVAQTLWDAVDSLVTNEHSRVLAIGNPDDPTAHFATVCKPGSGWNVIQIDGYDTPNVTGEKVDRVVAESLLSVTWIEERKERWGEESPLFQAKVRGRFPENADDTVVPLSWLIRCRDVRHSNPSDTPTELGFDVGAGGDAAVIAERRGLRLCRIWETTTRDPERLAEWAVSIIDEVKPVRVKIDEIGVGWGIMGSLRTEGKRDGHHPCDIIGINAGGSPFDKVRFPKKRDEMWWAVGRELSEPVTCGEEYDEVDDDGRVLGKMRCDVRHGTWDFSQADPDFAEQVIAQLTAPKYGIDATGRIKVEPKADTKERIGRSPDHADAVLLAFTSGAAQAPVLSPGGAKQTSGWR